MFNKSSNKGGVKLSRWFWEPARFSLLSLGLVIGTAILYSFVASSIIGVHDKIPSWPLLVLLTGIMIFSICKMIKRLPDDKINRKDFVTIATGLAGLYFLMMALSVTFFLITAYKIALSPVYSPLFFGIAALVSLFYMYVLGLALAVFYSTYLRAVSMGVPKLKAALSMPFAMSMLWLSGYALPEEGKNKSTAKQNWYTKTIDWIIAKPTNLILLLFAIVLIAILTYDYYILMSTVLFGVIFVLWLTFTGAKKLRKNISGAYSTVAAVLNVVFILLLLGLFTTAVINPIDDIESIKYGKIEITQSADK